MKKFLFATTLCFDIALGITFNIPLNNLHYAIEKKQGYDYIHLQDGIPLNNPGAPGINSLVYTYVLPPEHSIENIQIIEEQWQEILGEYYLYPEQRYSSLEKLPQFTGMNLEIYNAEIPYPPTPIIRYKTGDLRGHHLFQLQVAPFKYLPKLKKLMVLKKLVIKADIKKNLPGIKPLRQSALSKTVFDKLLSPLSINPLPILDCAITENPEDLSPTELPSLIGPPVDLVIITKEDLVQGYQKFAYLKKLLGYNTVIKTLSWIRQHYLGIDDAERIRNFIKEAVEKWGTSFVLLGGDVPDIPARSVWLNPIGPDPWPGNISTDLYYSCLDGTWNFDGDAKFGEVADSVDLYPEVFVGRLTLKDPNDITSYTNKIYRYHFPTIPIIHNKTLFITSNLFYPNDAYELALLLSGYLPQWFVRSFLNERPLQNFKDSIYAGYGIIQAIGHGDVNLLRINSSPQYATNFFFDSLINYNQYPIMISISCYTNPFQSDCLGEHFVNNPAGGGIAYIGPSGTSEGYLHTHMMTFFYTHLFSQPLAGALGISKIPFIPNASNDSWHRYHLYSINLLGDPTVTIWDSIPSIFDTVIVHPDTINVGIDTIIITVNPQVDSFAVVYYKEREVFVRDSGFAGSIVTEIKTKSPGYLKYTIINKRSVPYIDSVYVKPSSPYLVFNNLQIIDSLHNNNGILNPGEDIFLYIRLKNNGNIPAENITALVTCSDSFISLIIDTTSYPVILPESTNKNLTPFHIRVKNAIPDAHSLNFEILLSYGKANIDSFLIIASAPKLQLFSQNCVTKSDTVLIFPYIENSGTCLADSVWCRVRALSDTITVIDSIAYLPPILPDSIRGIADTMSLIFNHHGVIKYNFRAYYRDVEVINRNIKIQSLPKPDSFVSIGLSHAIGLKWKPVSGAIGYRIFRAPNVNGPYKLLRNSLLRTSYFEDIEVLQHRYYYYYLYAIDSSLNQGRVSDTVPGITNPMIARGWPKPVYGYPYTSPNFGDLDPYYPNLEILIATRDDGAIYAWHYDGTPVVQTPYHDGRIFVAGGPLWASPAIGDINNDGKMDIVFGIRRTTNNLYAITLYDSIWLPLPNWPITVPGNIFSAPVLGDLDNDGNLEIIVRTEQADIYVFRYDGSGFFPPNGLLFNGPGNAYGAPAVGDLNKDGNLEIIACGGSWSESLYVWDSYGNYLPPFPIFIQSEKRLQTAVVIGDVLGDARLEISFFADSTRRVYLVGPDGNILWFRTLPSIEFIESYPVFADITGDREPEIICGESRSGVLAVFDSLGNPLNNFPLISQEHTWRRLISADLNNDNISDMIIPTHIWKIYGYDRNAQSIFGFPINLGNYLNGAPAVYDIDLDGRLELMVAPCDFKFYVFDLNTTKYEWPRFRYDQFNSGWYKSENLIGIHKTLKPQTNLNGLELKIFPNPGHKNLIINFRIPSLLSWPPHNRPNPQSEISLAIYDVSGRLIRSFDLLLKAQAQVFSIIWSGDDSSGRNVPAGVYFIKLQGPGFNKVTKAVLIK